MSTKSKKATATTASSSTPRTTSTTTSTTPTNNTTTTLSSTSPLPTASPGPASEQRCYCSDPRPLQSDLICSHNSSDCYATHVSCLKDNDGAPFNDYVLGRSCFLCAHCVGRKGFRHPVEMEVTLESRHGCFYEKKGFTKQREAELAAAAAAVAVTDGKSTAARELRDDRDKEEVEVEEIGGKAEDTRMEDDEVERITNGHATHATCRRSTRTSADNHNSTSAAANNNSTSSSPISLFNTAAGSSSSSAAAAESMAGVEDEPLEPKKAKRRGIRDADKKAKAKLVPRCTSPSHFLTDDPAALVPSSSSSSPTTYPATSSTSLASASASAASLPSTSANSRHIDKLRTDALLSSISSMYYRPRLVHPSAADVYVSADYDRFEYPTVDALLSPLRKPAVLDDWSPLEVALFESGICSYGKDFHAIARLMAGRKTCGQCVEFYYVWKKSGHYAMWKEYGKPVRRRADSKAEQWRVVEERMRGFSRGQDDEVGRRKRAEEVEEARERERIGGENGQDSKKAKLESGGSEIQSAAVKAEEHNNNVGSSGVRAEASVPASSSVTVS